MKLLFEVGMPFTSENAALAFDTCFTVEESGEVRLRNSRSRRAIYLTITRRSS